MLEKMPVGYSLPTGSSKTSLESCGESKTVPEKIIFQHSKKAVSWSLRSFLSVNGKTQVLAENKHPVPLLKQYLCVYVKLFPITKKLTHKDSPKNCNDH